jgi:hypothetical protein
MHKRDEEDIIAVIGNLQRMTSGNISHIRDNCIGSLRSVIALSKLRTAVAPVEPTAVKNLMTYYEKLKNDPIRWAEKLKRNREYDEANREKKNAYNREYGREYRKLKK